jgi:Type II secretion system (T2SS), protein E, N-terminal domain
MIAMIRKQKLGELLLQLQLISEDDLDLVIAEQESRKLRLGELIYEKNIVSKDGLIHAIESLTHCKYYDTDQIRPDATALLLISRALAQKHCCVPIRINDKSIEVVFAEPQDLAALNEVSFATGLRVVPFMNFRAAIRMAQDRLYGSLVSESNNSRIATGDDIEFISASSRQSHQEAMREFQASQSGQKTEAVRLVSSIWWLPSRRKPAIFISNSKRMNSSCVSASMVSSASCAA